MDAQNTQLIELILPVAGAVTVIGGAWLTLQKISSNTKKAQQEQELKVLNEAKEEIALMKTELESKIAIVKSDLKNLENNVNKDMEHIRETYNGEIRNLGLKIEELRSELRSQHGSLVSLLTKMIDNKD